MINKLVTYLKQCDDAYYNTSNPLVSDDTYDALVESLRRMDPTNEYLSKVGAQVRSDKVGRLTPMGTLEKYHTEEDIKKWLSSEGGMILLSPKYDGFAVELIYQDGILISASTRGDGHVGEDVTEAVKNIKSIPQRIEGAPSYLIVRGEAIIPTKNHESVKGLGYTAMRNAVPGIVRSNRVDALKYVDYVAYEFIDGCLDREEQRIHFYSDFIIEDYRIYSATDVESMKSRREELRASEYKYELDGVVLKTLKIKEDDLLHPAHLIAWKYKSNRETTILRDLEFQVGPTGNISVVGIFDEVEFQGAKLTRASIGSLQRYETLQPSIGDMIEVSRRGDIIPYIEDVVLHESPYKEVTICPCCGTPLIDYKCKNKDCPDKVRLKIFQYVKNIGINGVGDALLSQIVSKGWIHNLADIYTLDATKIGRLPRRGDAAVNRWIQLQRKLMSPLEFLSAYPFENIGKATWESLLTKFTLSEILSLDKDTLIEANLKGLGEGKIESIVSQLEENSEELRKLSEILYLL